MDATRTIIGFFNPSGSIPSFVIPIIEYNDKFYVQDESNGIVSNFIEYNIDPNKIDKIPPRLLSIGSEILYGFVLEDKSILLDSKINLQADLRTHLDSIKLYTFIYIEVCGFLGMTEERLLACARARDILAEDNPTIAEEWFTSMQE